MIQPSGVRADDEHQLRGLRAVYRAGGLVGLALVGQDGVAVQIDDHLDRRIFLERLLDRRERAVVGTGVGRRIEQRAQVQRLDAVLLERGAQLVAHAHYIVPRVSRALGLGRRIGEGRVRSITLARVGVEHEHLRPVALGADVRVRGETGGNVYIIVGIVVDGEGRGLVRCGEHRRGILGGGGHINALALRLGGVFVPCGSSRARHIDLGRVRAHAEFERGDAGEKAGTAGELRECLLRSGLAAQLRRRKQRACRRERAPCRRPHACPAPVPSASIHPVRPPEIRLINPMRRGAAVCQLRYRSISSTEICWRAMLTA